MDDIRYINCYPDVTGVSLICIPIYIVYLLIITPGTFKQVSDVPMNWGLGLWPLSVTFNNICQLYHGGQIYCCKKKH
jgi:hypothetical protein